MDSTRQHIDLKVVLMGSHGVGKSCLAHRYVEGSFDHNTTSTIGVAYMTKEWARWKVAIWDTAGQERFNSIPDAYVRGAGAVILAYDMSSQKSFENLKEKCLPKLDAQKCLKVVVGTKKDLDQTVVATAAAKQFAREINGELSLDDDRKAPAFETSSKTGEGVTEVFEYIFGQCLGRLADSFRLTTQNDSIILDEKQISVVPESGCCVSKAVSRRRRRMNS